MTRKELIVFNIYVIGITAILIYLRAINQIDTSQLISIIITSILVIVTAIYAKRTAEIANATKKQVKAIKDQAEASMQMAEEMREQNRPIIVIKYRKFSNRNPIPFEIENIGNSPAIDLEVRMIDKSLSVQDKISHKKTYLSYRPEDNNWKIDDYLLHINNHLNNPCVIVCRYHKVISSREKRRWLYTKLPFIAYKGEDNSTFIHPEYLEFFESENESSWEK